MSDPTLPPEQPEQPYVPPAAPGGDYGPPPPAPPPPPPPPPPAPPAYGAPPPAPGYAAPPPGYAAAPPPGYAAPMGDIPGNLAQWPARFVGGLIDYFVPFLIAGVFFAISHALGSLLYLAALAWVIYNKYLEGTTGQSYGKKIAGTRLVRAQDGGLVGGGTAIVRWICHIVDGLPCYVGYLWPLWDAKRQTFADKIMSTYVVTA